MALPEPQPTTWQQSTVLDPTRAALVVVDILGAKDALPPALTDMADKAVTLVEAARLAGVPVVFACDQHLPEGDLETELWGAHCVRGTTDSLPLDAFQATADDYVLPKRRYSAFVGTDLDLWLREKGREELIVIGFDTNICVLHTLASAFFLGYRTVVPADATASFLVGTQEGGLEYFSRVFDTRVTTTQQVLHALSPLASDGLLD